MTQIVPLDYRNLSYKPLFLDYLHRFEALAPFFPGDPYEPGSWQAAASALERREHPRVELFERLEELNRTLGADEQALSSLEALRDGALAVVTGQQVGILGGPLYTLYKALTAVRIAQWSSSLLGRKVVPIFWMDADDHDFEEVQKSHILSTDGELVELRYEGPDGENRIPVGSLELAPAIEGVLGSVTASLPQTEFKEELVSALSDLYAPGRTLTQAFGGLLLRLTRGTGLTVLDPTDPTLKRLGSGLFQREIREGSRSSAIVHETTERLVAAGYHAQATPADGQLNLFYADPGRHPIHIEPSGLKLVPDGEVVSAEVAERRVAERPECFSPNVLLRPVYQDTLLPTLCYVAGPNELAYFAQLRGVYEHFGVEMPLIASRASFTVVERSQARFLERYHVDVTRLDSNDESLLNEILRRLSPPQLEEDLSRARACIQDITDALERDLSAVDQTLVPTVASTRGKLLHHLKDLESKALRAVKRKNDTVRNQFLTTRTALFPGFAMQERKLSSVVFLNKYGWHFSRMVEESADPAEKNHLLLYM